MGPYPSVGWCLCDLYALDTRETRPVIFLKVQCGVSSESSEKSVSKLNKQQYTTIVLEQS